MVFPCPSPSTHYIINVLKQSFTLHSYSKSATVLVGDVVMKSQPQSMPLRVCSLAGKREINKNKTCQAASLHKSRSIPAFRFIFILGPSALICAP